MASKNTKGFAKPQSTSLPEWILGAIGAALVLLTIGYLVYFGATASSKPPTLDVVVRSVARIGENYLVNIDVGNESAQSAAHVRVVGRLDAGSAQESSETVFDYIPAFSVRRGGLLFRNDPAAGRLQIGPQSFTLP